MGDSLQIVGEMAGKIKNNVREQPQQFSWKLTFPKEVAVEDIPTEGVMILNKSLKRLRYEFTTDYRENALLISPQTPYKSGQEYFFWAKCRRKEICIAFVVTENGELQTYDQKTSMEKLNSSFKRENKRAAAREAAAQAAALAAAQRQEKPAKPVPQVID